MEWTRQKVNSESLNNGQEYTTDSQVSIESLNAMINSGLYSQDVVDGLKAQPYSAVANYKYPNIVTYNGSSYMAIYQEDGEYTEFNGVAPTVSSYWALLAQKGTDGVKGDSGINSALLSNTAGTSDTNGYTQQAVNGIISNPNLVINPNFAINQRGKSEYSGSQVYTVDRWRTSGTIVRIDNNKVFVKYLGANFSEFAQFIEYDLTGKTVTLSATIDGIRHVCKPIVCSQNMGTSGNLRIQTFGDMRVVYATSRNCYAAAFYLVAANAGTSEHSIEDVKLEIGSVATAFTPPTIVEELPKCQRYYQLRTADYTFPTSALDRMPVMYKNGTIGTTTISGTSYKYCDAEI